MNFSSPDFPLFLIAVFFLYALARWGGRAAFVPRIILMVLLGDVIFMLVAKDLDALWDPIGGTLLRLLASAASRDVAWGHLSLARMAMQDSIGLGVLFGALWLGRHRAAWIVSDRGQRLIARGVVAALGVLGIAVATAVRSHDLDAMTTVIAAHGHLVLLFVLGLGIGLTRDAGAASLGRVVLLFVASSLFYQAWASGTHGPYRYLLGTLLCTIVLDYFLGIWIEQTEDPWQRKLLVVASLVSNLSVLAFFKYSDFFAQDILEPATRGLAYALHRPDLHVRPPLLNLILPAGISFHTFQSLSYTIDVYRRQLPATRSVLKFATFVLFFPQLVAGPIVRAQDLMPQLDTLPALDLEQATLGLYRIVVGLFKKIAVADTLRIAIVDRVFDTPQQFSALEVLVGVYGFALEIYLDFSAYSDIAIGSAQLLGFTLPENFRTPYRSANLQEFWRRWHISLSTWLRDYLYITLGGSKGAPWRTYLNLIATMLLGGLWHGASWAFVVWGALHGFGLAITRYFQRTAGDVATAARLYAMCVAIAVTGLAIDRVALTDAGVWVHLAVDWVALLPLWAVTTAWLGREPAPAPPPTPRASAARAADVLRIAMFASGVGFVLALGYLESWTWVPCIAVTWGFAIAAEVAERGFDNMRARLVQLVRRGLAIVLVFHYVCLAWIFFRAVSFDRALAILRQLGTLETDHANVVPLVTTALAAGFACHFFPDGGFRWLRERFVDAPPWAQGAVLATVALVLRELGHTKIVPFIYFQF